MHVCIYTYTHIQIYMYIYIYPATFKRHIIIVHSLTFKSDIFYQHMCVK